MTSKCYYHRDRIAVDKCEKCGKYLCVDCKIRDRRYRHTGYRYRNRILCPICKSNTISFENSCVVLSILISAAIFLILEFQAKIEIIVFIFAILFIGIICKYVSNDHYEFDVVENKRRQIENIQKYGHSGDPYNIIRPKSVNGEVKCKNCQNAIKKDEWYCPNCGKSVFSRE